MLGVVHVSVRADEKLGAGLRGLDQRPTLNFQRVDSLKVES